MTKITALRYPAGTDFLSYDMLPSGVTPEPIALVAEDGVKSRGTLYATGREKTVLYVMHPRADMTRHYAVPGIVSNGYAFFTQVCRTPGDDLSATTIHEHLLADVAAAMRLLRERGFENIVLIGNSGAASLFSFYLKQAKTPPPGRLTTTAAGDPFDLNQFDMPVADGIIFLGPHIGAGLWLQENMDPSVTDEADPTSCDASLDLFNPDNGFREPPQYSEYSDVFVQRFRAGQAARSARIDALAWSMIRDQATREEIAAETAGKNTLAALYVRREAIAGAGQRMLIHRLDANPSSVDQTTAEPGRTYGSLFAVRPDILNFSLHTSKLIDPRAWLSSWSARYSRARLLDNLDAVSVPTLVLAYVGDNTVHKDTARLVFDRSPATTKDFKLVLGDHFGFFDASSSSEEGGRAAAIRDMVDWLRSQFPSIA